MAPASVAELAAESRKFPPGEMARERKGCEMYLQLVSRRSSRQSSTALVTLLVPGTHHMKSPHSHGFTLQRFTCDKRERKHIRKQQRPKTIATTHAGRTSRPPAKLQIEGLQYCYIPSSRLPALNPTEPKE
ncbi:hypothetical protein KC332_g33 [Hortaea werneckii]|nr:hypothetical protein KC332_g33 [Hortaea werneckii]